MISFVLYSMCRSHVRCKSSWLLGCSFQNPGKNQQNPKSCKTVNPKAPRVLKIPQKSSRQNPPGSKPPRSGFPNPTGWQVHQPPLASGVLGFSEVFLGVLGWFSRGGFSLDGLYSYIRSGVLGVERCSRVWS